MLSDSLLALAAGRVHLSALVLLIRPRHVSGLNWSGTGGASGSVPWNIVVLLTLLTLLPALLVAMTPFARLLVVFHFLRQALGTQTAPSNQTLIGLSLVLTYFLMQPVGAAIHQAADRALRARPAATVWRQCSGELRRCAISC